MSDENLTRSDVAKEIFEASKILENDNDFEVINGKINLFQTWIGSLYMPFELIFHLSERGIIRWNKKKKEFIYYLVIPCDGHNEYKDMGPVKGAKIEIRKLFLEKADQILEYIKIKYNQEANKELI